MSFTVYHPLVSKDPLHREFVKGDEIEFEFEADANYGWDLSGCKTRMRCTFFGPWTYGRNAYEGAYPSVVNAQFTPSEEKPGRGLGHLVLIYDRSTGKVLSCSIFDKGYVELRGSDQTHDEYKQPESRLSRVELKIRVLTTHES